MKGKSNIEGSELLDCEAEPIDNCDNENDNTSDETMVTMENPPLNSQEPSSQSNMSFNLLLISSNPDIK